MYIPNDETQNYPFCKLELVMKTLNTQPNDPTNQNSLKSHCFKPTNKRKRSDKTLGTSVKNSPMSPPSLSVYTN